MRKVSFEIRVREYCSGCGMVFHVQFQSAPNEQLATKDYLALACERGLEMLGRYVCPECKMKTDRIGLYDYSEKLKIKKSKQKRKVQR